MSKFAKMVYKVFSWLTREKCKYYDRCDGARPDSFNCVEAGGQERKWTTEGLILVEKFYCGKHRQFEEQRSK